MGLLKIMEAKNLNCLGFEPEHVQCLIHNAIYELGPQNFMGLRQAALYALMFWGTARFEEVRELEMRQIMKKELPMKSKSIRAKQIRQGSSKSVSYTQIL